MRDKHGRASKPFRPLHQMRMCDECGQPFFPSRRHKYLCLNCREIAAAKRRHGDGYFG